MCMQIVMGATTVLAGFIFSNFNNIYNLAARVTLMVSLLCLLLPTCLLLLNLLHVHRESLLRGVLKIGAALARADLAEFKDQKAADLLKDTWISVTSEDNVRVSYFADLARETAECIVSERKHTRSIAQLLGLTSLLLYFSIASAAATVVIEVWTRGGHQMCVPLTAV